MVDHAPEQRLAVGSIFRGVEYVLMPELVQVVPPFRIKPRNEHESGPQLKERKEPAVFPFRGHCAIKIPMMLFDHRFPNRFEIEFRG